jgi:acetyl-CoA carboxylase biotin carboxyl carrier protein
LAAAPVAAPAPAPAPAAPVPAPGNGAAASPGGAAGAPAPGAAPTTTIPADGTKIESPSVGLFWRAPSPGAPPFVEVGQQVAAGDTVAIVEVMKLMNHVAAPVDGVVTAILVENGESVEFGQPLVVIDPEG